MGAYIIDDSKEVKKLIGEIFSRFSLLKERKNQLAKSLSGGEQRILDIARAMMLKPKLIFLDEPSIGLAPKVVEEIYQRLDEIDRDEESTIVVVEQNVRKALSFANYAYILKLGRNEFDGKSEEILKSDKLRESYLG
jgi:branched-chain amino acid transport system ATP-binding protein